jgi:hypothetical protein
MRAETSAHRAKNAPARDWPRYYRYRGELVDLDAPVRLAAKGVARG